MGSHIIDGEFQSDKYPTCPRGKVPLSVKDKDAQDLLWEYARRHESRDEEFSRDVRASIVDAGYDPSKETILRVERGFEIVRTWRVIDTDNFGGDYPNEKFIVSGIRWERDAKTIADALNKKSGEHASRFYRVVPHVEIQYKLQPGFEP